ncbi:MAG TPA: hypothetical protein DCM38_02445 [Gammaproteobacteria bacterium]|nr:hypothetical protein [Gammaproteobacteria bacterium]
MCEDEIIEEIREIRKTYAAQFNFDLDAIYRDLKAQEKASGHQLISFPPRPYMVPIKNDLKETKPA